jgi:hypothetical protein
MPVLNLKDERPMICFLVQRFKLPMEDGVAIVYARDREEVKRILRPKLALACVHPDFWTIDPLTPCPPEPSARVLDRMEMM